MFFVGVPAKLMCELIEAFMKINTESKQLKESFYSLISHMIIVGIISSRDGHLVFDWDYFHFSVTLQKMRPCC